MKQQAQKSRRKFINVFLLAVIAFGVGAYLNYKQIDKPLALNADEMNVTLLKQARDIQPFELSEYQHPIYNNKSLLGKWTMMFFGFTNCPMLCPTTLAELNQAYALLEQQHAKVLPQVVLVSIDPERDTAKKVFEYAQGFNPNFIGVRAEKSQIDELTKALGIVYFKTKKPGAKQAKDYTLNHSGAIILFNPQGQVAGFFNTPHHAKAIAQDFMKVARA